MSDEEDYKCIPKELRLKRKYKRKYKDYKPYGPPVVLNYDNTGETRYSGPYVGSGPEWDQFVKSFETEYRNGYKWGR